MQMIWLIRPEIYAAAVGLSRAGGILVLREANIAGWDICARGAYSVRARDVAR